ncbi:hypothetical protein EV356DRAFT_489005 [Viridothelium virens]|uniref:GPI inositol-deacylase n=1 Tax=Viridothelium virens TaxID=1048519 RepID=A0A6A6H2U7_VIRVR|nr:hypothetical protein EV356DRAFT_489005 [Viridothelium virens]
MERVLYFRRRTSPEESLSRLEQALNGLNPRRPQLGRSAASETNESITGAEDSKGSLGLNLLYAVEEPLIDFIFVHGLGGGSRKSWAFSSDAYHYWPKEWLSRDQEFRCVRVHSFGYKADLFDKRESVADIYDFALALLREIEQSPEIRRSKTRIVLIAHSMGGIVCKKAYMLAREDPSTQELASRIHTMYFFGTPHRGSDLVKSLEKILKISYGPKHYVSDLRRNSSSITAVNDGFRHFAEDLQLWSFYETLPCNLFVTNALIVDKGSATLGYARERTSLLNADHRSMNKFDLPSDPNYKTIRNAFITTIDSILSDVSQSSSSTAKEQHDRLVQLTGIAEPPLDDLIALEDMKVTGSCEWLTSKESYVSWRTPWSNSRAIFWLTGIAASGKSVLCSHVVSNVQEQNSGCSYFFFKHGNAVKSSIASCLISLAYQMAMSNESILQRLLDVGETSSPWDRWDEKTIWRKLFIGCIFKETRPMPHFWILDALDECQRYPILLTFLAQVPPYLRVFLTSRNTAEVEQGVTRLSSVAIRYEIQPEDTLGDLKVFVESRMDLLPTDDERGRTKLKDRILGKASGCFLWTALVVQELQHTYSEEGAEEVLNDVPTDMDDLYAKMLDNIPTNARARKLAKSLFTWALSSFRALNLDEMQCAIKLDTGETVHHLDRTISAVCGQLIRVDKSHHVQIIHQTAKTWLLDQNVCADFEIDRAQSHSRVAQSCLRLLVENLSKGARFRRTSAMSSTLAAYPELTDYACFFFSDHLQKCSSDNSKTWNLLHEFFHGSVLSWIEHLARSGRIYNITRTASNLRAYLTRRAKHLAPFSAEKESMEAWINDLIRLSARFRACLMTSPASIHTLIPALCPVESVISRTFASRQRGLIMDGLLDQTWPDCLGRIDYLNQYASAVSHGERYSAVAVSNGTVFLYYRDSLQVFCSLNHERRVNILKFSGEDQYLATASSRMIKIWALGSRTMLWAFSLTHQALAINFLHENGMLAAAVQGNYTISWDLQEGLEIKRWQWIDCIYYNALHQKPRQPPGKALFSTNNALLAVYYRGLPVYLFDTENEYHIGYCSRQGSRLSDGSAAHYTIDALDFNPSPEIDILIVSYGDGELAMFDLYSTEMLYSRPSVYAHSLACSPDGRLLVTGSSRGTIEIFEFGGTQGQDLSLIYRIDSFEDGIRGIAFSSDSLRFADIRGSQFRIWEPAVLARTDLDEGSQSELSQAIALAPKSVSMLEGPPEAEVTTLSCHSSGNVVFCGKQDGSVVYFDTHLARQGGVLYRHALNVAVTCTVYSEGNCTLATADESGRVLIRTLIESTTEYRVECDVSEIRSDESLTALLYNSSGTRILLQGTRSAEIWTIEGEQIGSSIPLESEHVTIYANSPTPEAFTLTSNHSLRTFSWANAAEIQPYLDEKLADLKLTHRDSSPSNFAPIQPQRRHREDLPRQSSGYIVYHQRVDRSTISDFSSLLIWPLSTITVSDPYPAPLKVPYLENLTRRVLQIIAVPGNLLLFIDTDYWVCSLDLASSSSIKHAVHRHFFVLSEWRSSNRDFIIAFVPANQEFIVARRHGLLVFRRGLECREQWTVFGSR